MDRYLDTTAQGPMYLRRPELANLVVGALQWIKGTNARQANQLLARTGHPFWQAESYDHRVRNAQQMERIVAYIENKPVKVGLVSNPSQYRWSSAWRENGELKFAAAR